MMITVYRVWPASGLTGSVTQFSSWLPGFLLFGHKENPCLTKLNPLRVSLSLFLKKKCVSRTLMPTIFIPFLKVGSLDGCGLPESVYFPQSKQKKRCINFPKLQTADSEMFTLLWVRAPHQNQFHCVKPLSLNHLLRYQDLFD